jgi:peptidoglycan/LPS O-acetylase OafA/YrhL
MRRHLVSLDGLRGVAALAVVASHFQNLSGLDLNVARAGRAVDFFFVLSGFVIAQAYEGRLARALSWAGYMRVRLERLYPAIFGALVLATVLTALAGEPVAPELMTQFLILPVLVGPMLNGGELFPLNGPQWSLLWEILINAVHAALSRWLTTPRLLVIVALAGVAVIATSLDNDGLDLGWGRQNAWGALPRVVWGFGVGVALFRAHTAGLRAPRVPYLLIVIALAACMARVLPEQAHFALPDALVVVLVMPVLTALAIVSPVPRVLLGPAAWLGALSYPLYAVHTPILRGFESVLEDLDDPLRTALWRVALPATIGLAAVFERFYDAPIRRWLAARRTGVAS